MHNRKAGCCLNTGYRWRFLCTMMVHCREHADIYKKLVRKWTHEQKEVFKFRWVEQFAPSLLQTSCSVAEGEKSVQYVYCCQLSLSKWQIHFDKIYSGHRWRHVHMTEYLPHSIFEVKAILVCNFILNVLYCVSVYDLIVTCQRNC